MPKKGTMLEDASTEWVNVYGHTIVKALGVLGGGTVALERREADGTGATIDESLVPKTWYIDLKPMQVRLTLTGSLTPNLEWQIL